MLPEKYSKELGNSSLKIGVNFKELFLISWIPFLTTFYDVHPFISLLSFFVALAVIAIKNYLFDPNYFKNQIEFKKIVEWKKIDYDRKN